MAKPSYQGLFSAVYHQPVSEMAGEGSPADVMARENYLAARRSPAPVNWWSDHLKESFRDIGAVYVAIKVLMDQAAAASLRLYQWEEEARMGNDLEHREALPRSHDLCRVFNHPNPKETGATLRRRRVQQLELTGTSLIWQVKDGFGRPHEQWNVPTGTYQPIAPSSVYPDGAYRIQPFWPGPLNLMPGAWNQGGVVVPARYITATRFPHPLTDQEGLSPLTACSLPLDTLNSIEQGRFARTQNAAKPDNVVEADPQILFPRGAELDRLKHELRQMYSGPWKTGSTVVLSPGLTMKSYGETDIEMGWVESWKQLMSFVMSIFGVSRQLAFQNEDTSYAILYAALKQFNLFTLMPLLQQLADADNLSLVWPFYGFNYFAEYEPKPIDDEELRERQINTDLQAGIRTINEIRHLRKLKKIDEDWGEERAINGAIFAQKPGMEGGSEGQIMPGQVQQAGEPPAKEESPEDAQLQSLLEGTAGNSQPNRMRQAGNVERTRPTNSGSPVVPTQGGKSAYTRKFARINGNGYHP
jgi:phage portal protein BeeE